MQSRFPDINTAFNTHRKQAIIAIDSARWLKALGSLYWYTVEFGLIEEDGALRAYGAGIVSSAGETVFSTTDPDVLRVRMNPERIMRTAYRIDDFQDVYFVIDDLQQLMTGLVDLDFGPIYTAYRDSEPFAPGQLLDGDTQVPITISPEDATS